MAGSVFQEGQPAAAHDEVVSPTENGPDFPIGYLGMDRNRFNTEV